MMNSKCKTMEVFTSFTDACTGGLVPQITTGLRGSGKFRYQVLERWEQLPQGFSFVEVAGVAVDKKDRVYVFNRGEHPVIVFDRDGKFVTCWGEGDFLRPHGIFIGPDDSVYCTDDYAHIVRKFTSEGKLLLTLGKRGEPSDTGVTNMDYRTIQRVGPPFNLPTNLALSPDGEMYVSDGYGNARVEKFSADGRLLLSWGEPGICPGQFHLPHGIAVDRHGRVYVADRENSRIQVFTPEGEFLTEWTDVARPCQLFIDAYDNVYVAEMGCRTGLFPGTSPPRPNAPGARVSVFNLNGELLARWGGGDYPLALGDFYAPHGIGTDSRGDLYVGEVTPGVNHDSPFSDFHLLQKFVRKH